MWIFQEKVVKQLSNESIWAIEWIKSSGIRKQVIHNIIYSWRSFRRIKPYGYHIKLDSNNNLKTNTIYYFHYTSYLVVWLLAILIVVFMPIPKAAHIQCNTKIHSSSYQFLNLNGHFFLWHRDWFISNHVIGLIPQASRCEIYLYVCKWLHIFDYINSPMLQFIYSRPATNA